MHTNPEYTAPMPMLVPPDADLPARHTPVEVVFLGPGPLLSRAARLIAHRGRQYELALDTAPPDTGREGAAVRVVLSIGGERPRRVTGRLVRQSGERLTVEVRAESPADKRRFPRLVAAIGLRWRALQSEGPWHEPDPLMNFSVVGFSFGGSAEETQEGDLLVLDFQVGDEGPRYPATARVARVQPREPAAVVGAETHEISIELLDSPLEAREALAELTLRIQRAMTNPHA